MANDQAHNTATTEPLDRATPDVTAVVAAVVAASDSIPAISSISGTLTNGSSITLVGSNFGSKTQAAPLEFQRFEGTDGVAVETEIAAWPGSSDNSDNNLGTGTSGGVFSTEKRHSGNTSVMNKMPDMGEFATNYHKYEKSDNVFCSYWVYVQMVDGDEYRGDDNGIFKTTQIKMLRITSDIDAGGGGVYNGAGTVSGGTWRWSPVFAYTAVSDNILRGPLDIDAGVTFPMASERFTDRNGNSNYNNLPSNKWVRIDMWAQNSSAPGVPDGVFGFNAVGGVGGTNRIYDKLVTIESGKSHQQNSVILGNMMANFVSVAGNSMAIYSDDVYIDNTRSKVEIGDNSDYYSCARLDICPATAWANGSVTATLNSEPVPNGTNYLFVMNDNGTPSIGYEVTI
jgi:hypothetical protein